MMVSIMIRFFFFFNDTATTEIYTLSLHDALPIYAVGVAHGGDFRVGHDQGLVGEVDRKSTRLNSSHSQISYAVFCLKKKKKIKRTNTIGWNVCCLRSSGHLSDSAVTPSSRL